MLAALTAHGLLLHETIFPASAMVFGFAYALSAMLWLGVGIFWIESLFFSLAGLGVLYATIQTRRHVALDLSAGVAVGVLCGMAVRHWLAQRALTLSIEPVST